MTEITNSLNTLDDLINDYETGFTTTGERPVADDADDDPYDDATSVLKKSVGMLNLCWIFFFIVTSVPDKPFF